MPAPPSSALLEPSPGSKRRGDISGWHVAAGAVFGQRKKQSTSSPGTLRREFLDFTERGERYGVEKLVRDGGQQVDINWKYPDNGDTALIRAARNQDEDMVRLLLMNGADVTRKNADNKQAIELAPFHIQELLLCPRRDKLFAHAAWQGDEQQIRALMKARGHCNELNSEGRPALLLLAESPGVFATLEKALLSNYRPAAVVQQLANHKSDMTVRDEEGRSALHLAVENNNDYALSIAVALVDTGMNTDTRDHSSATPLHTASAAGHTSMMEMLLKRGANINATDQRGASPLHRSAQGGHKDACDLLLDRGADPASRDEAGQCPFDLAPSPNLHKRLKQAWVESAEAKESDTRLAAGYGDDDMFDSDDSVDDETMTNIAEEVESVEHHGTGSSIFVTAKSPRSLQATQADDRRWKGQALQTQPSVVDDPLSGDEDCKACSNSEPEPRHKILDSSRSTLPRQHKHQKASQDDVDGAGVSGEEGTEKVAVPEDYELDFCSDSGDEVTGATQRGLPGEKLKRVNRQTSQSSTNSQVSDSPKKRRKRLRKQGSSKGSNAGSGSSSSVCGGALSSSPVKKTIGSPGGNLTSRPTDARVWKTSANTQANDWSKTKAKSLSAKPDTAKARVTKRTVSSSQLTAKNGRNDGSTGKATARKVVKKAGSMTARSQQPTAVAMPARPDPLHLPARLNMHTMATADLNADNRATTAGAAVASNNGQDDQGTGQPTARRESLPALGMRPRRKSATQPDPPSVVQSTYLQISFNDQKQPVVTKWQHDAQYMRKRGGKVEPEPSGNTDSMHTRRSPAAAAGTTGTAGTGQSGSAAGTGAGVRAPPKHEPDLLLPHLSKSPMAGSPVLRSRTDSSPLSRSRSKTISRMEQHSLSSASLTTSQVSLAMRTSSRSNMLERSPKPQQRSATAFELPHIGSTPSAINGSTNELLKLATARRVNAKLAPLNNDSGNESGSTGNAGREGSGVGMAGHYDPNATFQRGDYPAVGTMQTDVSQPRTEEIFVTEQNLSDLVAAIDILSANAEKLKGSRRSLSPLPTRAISRMSSKYADSDESAPTIRISPTTAEKELATDFGGAYRDDNDPNADLPDIGDDRMVLLQALREAQDSQQDIPLTTSCLSPIQSFPGSNDPIQALAAGDNLDDDAMDDVTIHQHDYSPEITAYIGPSRPGSRQAPYVATRPSTATQSSNSLFGSRIGGGGIGGIGGVGGGAETMSASNMSLMGDEDQGEGDKLVFRKGKLLGSGGFGRVYMCMIDTGETIAMKEMELSSELEEAEQQFSSIQKEVNTLRLLDHINIVKYMGASLCEGSSDNFKVRIFMELVAGGSIADRVKQSTLPSRVCRVYTQQILYAVEYLHNLDIIHRDIKGANIMVTNMGIVKLIDFGTAKHHLQEKALTNYVKGTPYWVAPEVIRESKYDKPVDIWSVGCTVFEMAVGHHPWYGWEVQAAYFAIGNYKKPKELDEAKMPSMVRDFIKQCMTDKPDQRPTATDLLLKHRFMQFENKTRGTLPRIGQDTLPERLPTSLSHWREPDQQHQPHF